MNTRFKIQHRIFAAIIFIAAIILLNNGGYLGAVKNFFASSMYYPGSFLSKAGFFVSNKIRFVFEIRKNYADNVFLTEENNKLRKEISDLAEVRNENKLLRSALDLPFYKEHSLVDAAVIGKDPYSFLNYLLVNRGSADNIKPGMSVVDIGGFYIGKISEVSGENIAKVILINDNESIVSAIDQNTRVKGLIKSDRDLGLYFDMVLPEDQIAAGDIVASLPLGSSASVYPIAKVASAENFPNTTFQKVKLLPLADLKKIEKVFILLD